MNHKKRYLPAILLVLITFLISSLPVDARYFEGRPPSRVVVMTGLVEVQFEADVSADNLSLEADKISFGIPTLDAGLRAIGAVEAVPIFPGATEKNAINGTDDMRQFYTITFDPKIDVNQVIDELRLNPYVRSAYPVYALPVDVNPDDPSFSVQWGLKKINDTAAYNIETGSDTAKIVIIDSGVLYSHPDLLDNIWVNPGEDLDGDLEVYDPDDSNMISNDGLNVYDDLVGYDFFAGFSGLTCWTGEDCNTPDNNPIDFNGHGTHCAGIAAAVSNNNLGVAGTAGGWGGGIGANTGPRIICCRAGGSAVDPDFGYEAGFIRSDNAATAISYSADIEGVCAINMSFGMGQSGSMSTALGKAQDSGIVLVHSAGNDGTEFADYYDTWERNSELVLMSVAWTNSSDRRDASSNYGTWIEISAPGSSIYSTVSNHHVADYAYFWGTSMSAPFVAGAVALIYSHMPDYDRDEITPLLMDNSDPMMSEPLWLQGKMGAGRLNTYNCLDSMPSANFISNSVLVGEAPLYVEFADVSPHNPTSWDWTFGDGAVASGDQNPGHTYTDYGLNTVTLTVNDDFGTHTEFKKNMVMVTADTLRPLPISTNPDTTIDMEVYMDNKYPVSNIVLPLVIRNISGAIPNVDIKLDSVVVEGCRAHYYDRIRKQSSDHTNKKYTWILYSNYYNNHSNYIPADTGIVLKLRFTIASASANEQLVVRDTAYGGRELLFESVYSDYQPVFMEGSISIANCEMGDANLDGLVNINDITLLIEWLYQGGWWPPDPICSDVNEDGMLNILDITGLIAMIYG